MFQNVTISPVQGWRLLRGQDTVNTHTDWNLKSRDNIFEPHSEPPHPVLSSTGHIKAEQKCFGLTGATTFSKKKQQLTLKYWCKSIILSLIMHYKRTVKNNMRRDPSPTVWIVIYLNVTSEFVCIWFMFLRYAIAFIKLWLCKTQKHLP